MDSRQVESSDAQLISVWSPIGSPGKSTIALSMATELAESGKNVFLLDADTWAPSLDLQLGLTDHPAGLAAACRLVACQCLVLFPRQTQDRKSVV